MDVDELENPYSRRLTLAFDIASYAVIVVTLIIAGVYVAAPEINPEPLLGLLGVVFIAVPLLGKLVIALLGRAYRIEKIELDFPGEKRGKDFLEKYRTENETKRQP